MHEYQFLMVTGSNWMSRDPCTPVARFFQLSSKEPLKQAPLCSLNVPSMRSHRTSGNVKTLRFPAGLEPAQPWAARAPSQPRTVAYCCEKPSIDGLGLRHLISSCHMVYVYLRNSPIGVVIEKEHMLHMLHEVAPSPPLSSLSLVSSNVMIMISASAVFRNRRSKGMFGFSRWNTCTFSRINPPPTVKTPAALFTSGTADVALARVYLYLKVNLQQAQFKVWKLLAVWLGHFRFLWSSSVCVHV